MRRDPSEIGCLEMHTKTRSRPTKTGNATLSLVNDRSADDGVDNARPIVAAKIPWLRTSERKTFKHCQQEWQWRYRKGLVPKGAQAPNALWFGTGIHLALEHRYSKPGLKRGKNVLGVWRDFVGEEQGNILLGEYGTDDAKWVDMGELGEAMLGAYLDEYGKDERWYVISAEQSFSLPIYRPLPQGSERDYTVLVNYKGRFDLVARDEHSDGRLWLWDHKTAKVIRTDHLALDDQAGSYWLAASQALSDQGIIPKGEPLDGILYNFLRKSPPDVRPHDSEGRYYNKPQKPHYLQALLDAGHAYSDKTTIAVLQDELRKLCLPEPFGEVSARQPTPNFHRFPVERTLTERRTQYKRIQDEALQMESLRTGVLPIVKNTSPDCKWCPFFNMCTMHENGDDWEDFRDMAFKREDPYLSYRKSTEE